jgi:selenide,water dikinase
MRQQLNEVMQGCAQALIENDCALIGGHTSESGELQFGLCVNGFSDGSILSKSGMRAGDTLILSKPLGTGTLLAADMRYQAKHHWIDSALASMQISNKAAAEIFQAHNASACTDITGFGLAGHLLEMIEANAAQVKLNLAALPLLPGALDCLSAGIFSSLHNDNASSLSSMELTEKTATNPLLQALFDPQTSGGLLASVPSSQAESCLAALKRSGLESARIIGDVLHTKAEKPLITIG